MSIQFMSKTQLGNMVDAIAADAAAFGATAGVVGLFQNDLTPTPATLFADLVEADFDGYAPVAVDETAFVFSNDVDGGRSFFDPDTKNFTAGGGLAATQTIYGWFWRTSTSGEVLTVNRFSQPIDMALPGQVISVTAGISFSPNQGRPFPGDT